MICLFDSQDCASNLTVIKFNRKLPTHTSLFVEHQTTPSLLPTQTEEQTLVVVDSRKLVVDGCRGHRCGPIHIPELASRRDDELS